MTEESLIEWAGPAILAGQVVFGVVGLLVGAVLVGEVRRQPKLGIHALALAAISVGGLGLVMITAGQGMAPGRVAVALYFPGEVIMHTGMGLLAAFVWKAFRPKGMLGATLYSICIAVLASSTTWDLLTQPDPFAYDDALPGAHLNQMGVGLPLLWGAVESHLEWREARKRHALGLTSLGACRRFMLWTLASSWFVGITALAVLAGVLRASGHEAWAALLQIARTGLYLGVSSVILITFFRPQWIEAEQSSPHAG